MKMTRELETCKLALESVTKVKEEREEALSIMHQDFQRALEQAVPNVQSQNVQLTNDLAKEGHGRGGSWAIGAAGR